MPRTPATAVALLALGAITSHAIAADDAARREFFENRVRPVLAAHCYACHGAAKHLGGLRVDYGDGLRKGGDSGPAVEPGNPDDSLLLRVVEHAEPGLDMPKNAPKLKAEAIAHLKTWIADGAYDPREAMPTAEESARVEWSAKFDDRRAWWSLQPPRRTALPAVRDTSWPITNVDYFILTRLDASGLTPARPADRVTLARRLAFLLTGLPMPQADLDAFLADHRADAYQRLVDRMLGSDHFGEKWARHWMDVVRYGDTYGYEWDIPAKGSWRYRDYLIRAFRDDVPFDQLVREQIAGDLLPGPRIDAREQINESLIGPMFYQLGEKRHGDSAMFDGIHQEMVNNKIDAFSKAFLGMTVGCARCHDHKLDAISQRDYYALGGIFLSPRWVSRTIDTPGRNAGELADLKTIKIALRGELSNWWRESARSWPALIRKPPSAWAEPLKAAGSSWEHLLRPWNDLGKARAAGEPVAAAWAKVAAAFEAENRAREAYNRANYRGVADFRREVPPGWSVDGVGFRDGPSPAGDFVIALSGPKAVGSVLPSGLYTHTLSPRLNGAIRTPLLNRFEESFLHVELAGGDFAAERVVVDNAFIAERQAYIKKPSPTWTAVSTNPDLSNRRVFIEWATKSSNPNFPPRVGLGGACSEQQVAEPQSWFGLGRVWIAKGPGSPRVELTDRLDLFAGDPPKSWDEAEARFLEWLRGPIDRWGRNVATDDDARRLDGLLDLGLLPNELNERTPAAVKSLVAAYREAEARVKEPQTVNGMLDAEDGTDLRLNIRGEYDQPGEVVARGSLGVFVARETPEPLGVRDGRSGRLELAERIASPDNPLTARVYVNRVWQWVFGQGIVASPDDFGKIGSPPSHPELLDHLTIWFVEHGWSTRALVRELLLSSTFRQGSDATATAREVDPNNRLLHHFSLRRLEAEEVRDSILAASGRLSPRVFGPPVNPNRPQEDAQKRLFSGPLDGDGLRSIYIKMTIMEPPKFLATFNQPAPKIPTGRRDVSNLPAQALALLNDPFVLGQAKVWGEAVGKDGASSPAARIRSMFLRAYGREPGEAETRRWCGLVERLAAARGVASGEALRSGAVWADVAHAIFNSKEFLYVR